MKDIPSDQCFSKCTAPTATKDYYLEQFSQTVYIRKCLETYFIDNNVFLSKNPFDKNFSRWKNHVSANDITIKKHTKTYRKIHINNKLVKKFKYLREYLEKKNFEKRMIMFDFFVKIVIMHGVEI